MKEFKRSLNRILLLAALTLSGGLLPHHQAWAQG
jgi:hypothetical protein